MFGASGDGRGIAFGKAADAAWIHSKTELAALDGFAESFGSTDAETELARLFAAKARLSDAVSALRAEYPKKRKLASSLGMLAGCAAALMLI